LSRQIAQLARCSSPAGAPRRRPAAAVPGPEVRNFLQVPKVGRAEIKKRPTLYGKVIVRGPLT